MMLTLWSSGLLVFVVGIIVAAVRQSSLGRRLFGLDKDGTTTKTASTTAPGASNTKGSKANESPTTVGSEAEAKRASPTVQADKLSKRKRKEKERDALAAQETGQQQQQQQQKKLSPSPPPAKKSPVEEPLLKEGKKKAKKSKSKGELPLLPTPEYSEAHDNEEPWTVLKPRSKQSTPDQGRSSKTNKDATSSISPAPTGTSSPPLFTSTPVLARKQPSPLQNVAAPVQTTGKSSSPILDKKAKRNANTPPAEPLVASKPSPSPSPLQFATKSSPSPTQQQQQQQQQQQPTQLKAVPAAAIPAAISKAKTPPPSLGMGIGSLGLGSLERKGVRNIPGLGIVGEGHLREPLMSLRGPPVALLDDTSPPASPMRTTPSQSLVGDLFPGTIAAAAAGAAPAAVIAGPSAPPAPRGNPWGSLSTGTHRGAFAPSTFLGGISDMASPQHPQHSPSPLSTESALPQPREQSPSQQKKKKTPSPPMGGKGRGSSKGAAGGSPAKSDEFWCAHEECLMSVTSYPTMEALKAHEAGHKAADEMAARKSAEAQEADRQRADREAQAQRQAAVHEQAVARAAQEENTRRLLEEKQAQERAEAMEAFRRKEAEDRHREREEQLASEERAHKEAQARSLAERARMEEDELQQSRLEAQRYEQQARNRAEQEASRIKAAFGAMKKNGSSKGGLANGLNEDEEAAISKAAAICEATERLSAKREAEDIAGLNMLGINTRGHGANISSPTPGQKQQQAQQQQQQQQQVREQMMQHQQASPPPGLGSSSRVRANSYQSPIAVRLHNDEGFGSSTASPELHKHKKVGYVSITFQLRQYKVSFGQRVGLIGSLGSLGNWDAEKVQPMEWREGDAWSATVDLPSVTAFEYKYVVIDSSNKVVTWEPGTNMYQRGFSADATVTRDWGQSISKILYHSRVVPFSPLHSQPMVHTNFDI